MSIKQIYIIKIQHMICHPLIFWLLLFNDLFQYLAQEKLIVCLLCILTQLELLDYALSDFLHPILNLWLSELRLTDLLLLAGVSYRFFSLLRCTWLSR